MLPGSDAKYAVPLGNAAKAESWAAGDARVGTRTAENAARKAGVKLSIECDRADEPAFTQLVALLYRRRFESGVRSYPRVGTLLHLARSLL